MLQPGNRTVLIRSFDRWLDTNQISCDDFLVELAQAFQEQATTITHLGQRQCVESAADCLAHASLAYYASFK